MIQRPLVRSIVSFESTPSGRSSLNHVSTGHSARRADDLKVPCGDSQNEELIELAARLPDAVHRG